MDGDDCAQANLCLAHRSCTNLNRLDEPIEALQELLLKRFDQHDISEQYF